jgi:hypothetical protein
VGNQGQGEKPVGDGSAAWNLPGRALDIHVIPIAVPGHLSKVVDHLLIDLDPRAGGERVPDVIRVVGEGLQLHRCSSGGKPDVHFVILAIVGIEQMLENAARL